MILKTHPNQEVSAESLGEGGSRMQGPWMNQTSGGAPVHDGKARLPRTRESGQGWKDIRGDKTELSQEVSKDLRRWQERGRQPRRGGGPGRDVGVGAGVALGG